MKEMALNDKEGSVFNVLDIEDFDEFKLALKEYCLSRLRSFHMALDTACITLVSLDQATENADWYEDIYVPYRNKLLACSDEILIRESQIKEIQDQLDTLYARKSEIQSILNFEDYLGNELYIEFCTYRREGEYHNDNYISDGLSNAEIIDRAKEFIEVAKKELIRSATKKYTISTNLHNLLLMEEFKPLANKFALGNFIRVRVGKDLFRLRLNSYHLTFSDLSTIDVEFSDMTKSINIIDATQKILSDAQSMASNFSYISKQAEKGEKANESVNNIVQNGLDSALTQIQNNINQEFVIDNNGILGRRYNDITGKYSPEQIRITNNIIALTENNWGDTTCALGKHKYTYYDVDSKTFKQSIGFGLSSKFSQNAFIYGSQIIGGDIYSENYSPTTGTHINLNDSSFNFGHKIIYDASTNKMTMKGVDIEWSSSTTPDISDIDGLTDELGNKITQTDFDNTIKNYSTTEQVDAKIKVSKTEISSEMSKQITETKTYADNAANTAQSNAIDSVNASTDEKLKSYSTTTEMNSAITQKADVINLSVTKQITETKTYASNVANDAQSNAIADTTEKLKSYSTTAQMDAAIDLKADAITSSVSATYETKGDSTSKYNALSSSISQTANSITSQVNAVEKNLTDNYSTTEEMNSAITQSANSITSTVSATYETKTNAQSSYTNLSSAITQSANSIKSEVSETYETKTNATVNYNTLQSSITQNADSIALKVSKTDYNGKELVSLINQTTEAVSINANKINLNGAVTANNYFKINIDGSMETIKGAIGGFTIGDNSITSGTWGSDGGVMMCTGSNVSKKIGGKDTNGWCFTAGSKFGVTKDGDVYASNLNATGGSITGSSINIGNGKFKVSNEGAMVCTGADIGARVDLDIGSSLGGWKTDINSIFKGTWGKEPTDLVFMCTGSIDTVKLAGESITSEDGSNGWVFGAAPNFGVTRKGEMYCKKGKIGTLTINSNGSLGKLHNGVGGTFGMMLCPDGHQPGDGRTYYIVMYEKSKPVGGLALDGWHSISV